MSKFRLILVFSFILCLGLFCLAASNNSTRNTLVIKETSDHFQLTASYNEAETDRVEKYINACLRPESVFQGSDDVDKDIILRDGTKFYIRSSPGDLLIKINTTKNTKASIQRIKNLCQGINGVINR